MHKIIKTGVRRPNSLSYVNGFPQVTLASNWKLRRPLSSTKSNFTPNPIGLKIDCQRVPDRDVTDFGVDAIRGWI